MVEESAADKNKTEVPGSEPGSARARSRPPPPAVSVARVGTPPVVKEDRPPSVELAAARCLLQSKKLAEDQKSCPDVKSHLAGKGPKDIQLVKRDWDGLQVWCEVPLAKTGQWLQWCGGRCWRGHFRT